MEQKFYEMKIAGCKRQLPLFPVNDTLEIAAFIIFGDVELTVAAAKKLLKKAPKFDVIVTPEAKSIPLAYEMAKQSKKPYYVARKGKKVYMGDPIEVEVKTITTAEVQHLYLSADDAAQIKGKRVLVLDDVISTGGAINAAESLVNAAGGNIVAKMAVLAEGDAAERDDIIFLEPLPLFFKEAAPAEEAAPEADQ